MKLQCLFMGLACLVVQVSNAQEVITYDAPCYDTSELFTELKNKYKETPILMGIVGDQAKSTMSLWINPKDDTWTIISTKKDTSCVIGIGVDFKLVPYKKTIGI